LAGRSLQTFRYDDLYRLTAAEGSYQFAPSKVDRYRAVLDYDTIDNITVKVQQHEVVGPSGNAIPQHKTSYDYRYAYSGAQPHAATHAGERTFAYDGNGNQAGWQDDHDGNRRTVVWDEENRIQSLFENGHEMTYAYDDTGDRVIKRGPQGETVYVNPYFTVRNRERATKHVWVGDRRLSSKLVKQNAVEKDLYFYHADQVGGTSFVTDGAGRLYEHFEYFPFGETWVQESSNTQRTPYAFTGKELDEETGLYSMGVRYYDPGLSTFNSSEPLLFAQPEKGREEPKFLAAYQYAYHNPVRNADPDGRDVLIIVGYDKDAPERQRFVNTADNLTKSLSGVNVHRLEIGPKGDAATLIAAKAAEIGKGKVSTVVWIGHGETSGQGFLPRQGESLSIDDAVKAAGIVKQGAIVAIGCKVQQNIHTNELRDREIKFYGTMDNFLFKNKTGEVSTSPTRKVVNPWQDPADIQLPEATRKIDPMKDNCPMTGCVFPIGPSILESEKRTGKANAPMK
jgi:RHS repeat-associated protein